MKSYHIILTVMLALAVCGCEGYDDSKLWKDVDESYNALLSFKGQLDALESETTMIMDVVKGGVITSITECQGGGYTVKYNDSKGVSHTMVIATRDELPAGPLVGTLEDETGVLCWTMRSGGITTFLLDNDGSRIPVSGRIPQFGVDASGYWTINGSYILDANGVKVLSEGKTVSVIKSVQVGANEIALTLSDDSVISLPYSGESVKVFDGDKEVIGEYVIPDGTTERTYTLSLPDNTKVKILECKAGLSAELSEDGRALTVRYPSNFVTGSITLMAIGNSGGFLARPVFFTTETGVNRFRGTLKDNAYFKIDKQYTLAKGCSYYEIHFLKNIVSGITGTPRKMKVVEVDLTAGGVSIEACYANDAVPNPNANGNSNNGFNKRELLSTLCARKCKAGETVLAGVNAGFFDSNDGISRGEHIERGEIQYIPNPSVIAGTPNHNWALTIYKDGTASCGKKSFSGRLQAGGVEFEYTAVNDTLLRGGRAVFQGTYPINIYTPKYMYTPNPEHASSLHNHLSKKACYIIAEYTGDPMYVNVGWTNAKILKILDGRTTALSSEPFLDSGSKQVGIQMFGNRADEVLSRVGVGDIIKLRADLTVEGERKPVYTSISSMWCFVSEGKDASASVPADHTFYTKADPLTMACVDKTGTRVFVIEIDGRDNSVSRGVVARECAQICLLMDAWSATRFDGGGSAAMWLNYNGSKKIVTEPSDSKGERSCLNYLYIKTK